MRPYLTWRIIFAIVCLTALVGMSTPHSVEASPPYRPSVYINFELVRKIACYDPSNPKAGVGLGTAEIVAKGIMLTAAHVINKPDLPVCVDALTKTRLRPYAVSREKDFALLAFSDTSEGDAEYLRYSCEGFHAGQTYQAIGYAHGVALILNRLIATDKQTGSDYLLSNNEAAVGMQIMQGDIFQGMSGGPILDQNGVMIGMNSATDHRGVGLSRSLRDTVLCQSAR